MPRASSIGSSPATSAKMTVGQVFYTPWCDEHGHVIDDGTVSRLGETRFRWTAADPSLRWFRQNAAGLDVHVEDISEELAALALQGPTSARVLARRLGRRHRPAEVFPRDQRNDRRRARRHLAHRLHRRSRLRDLDAGAARGARVGCADGGGQAVRHQAGRHARARRGARRSRPAAHRRRLLQQQEGADRRPEIHAVRDGPRPARQPRQGPVHRPAGARARARAPARGGRSSDCRSTGPPSNRSTRRLGLAPAVGATASRIAVPVYKGGKQVGKATTTTWSPVLKRMIALATVDRPHYADGHDARDRADGRSGAPPGAAPRSCRRRSSTRRGRRRRRRRRLVAASLRGSKPEAHQLYLARLQPVEAARARDRRTPSCSPTIIWSNAYSRSSRFEYGPGV